MKKQCGLILLVLCVAVSLLTPGAAAAEPEAPAVILSGTWGDHASFELTEDGVFTITGTGELRADQMRITYPSPDTNLPAFDTLVVSEGITRIGGNAFAAWGMKEAILYGDVGGSAFWECTRLETVYVMNAEEIGTGAFTECAKLQNVYLADTVKSLNAGAFDGCKALEEIRSPRKIMTLHTLTFRDCAKLKTVIMPAVQHVEQDCFLNCTALKEIYYAGTEAQLQSLEYNPAGNVTFEEAEFILLPAMPDPFYGFFDLPAPDDWAYEGICFCLDNGYMAGMGDGYFRPDDVTTRAQLVTILWRVSGEPKAAKAAPFTDVNQPWAADAIAWAAENGIVNGVGDNRFEPDGPITREQLVTIFCRYCRDWLKTDMTPGASLASFPDAAQVSDWAKDAMAWGIASKLISGVGTDHGVELQPKGSATRAQIARVILNFVTGVSADAPESEPQREDQNELRWTIDREGTLTITGSGPIPDYPMTEEDKANFRPPQTPWVDYYDEIRAVVIGEGITRVGDYVFCNEPNLKRVTLPSTLREIGDYAFYSAPIRVLKLPEGLVSIGDYAFGGADILELEIPETVTTLGEGAFVGCMSVQTIRVPDSVRELPKDVFCNCPCLKTIYLPGTLQALHADAFRMTVNLENTYFSGTQAQWDALMEQAPGFFAGKVTCSG